ncbi:hypothetical protein B0H13DRAFT_2316448 [Mycena leptocephala]|nr:hypothetical protein B0H13DRAFT_2316448 [Mycena leptocephala]
MAIWRSSSLLRASLALRRAPVHASFRGLASSTPSELKKTGLYDFHVSNAGRMVSFAGYLMPLSYGDVGQVVSHNHVRNSVGLFDVGHMVQSIFRGSTATGFLEWLTPSSLSSLEPYTSTLSVLLNERGGIIDDLIITKHAQDAFYVVTNAGRRDRDLEWFNQRLAEWNAGEQGMKGPVEMELLDGWGLLALQGPKAASYLQSLTAFDLTQLTFGKSAFLPIEGFNLHVARGGYTGEDGFEISIPPSQTVEPAPRGWDVSYGNDLDEDTSPVEAGLTWVIGKERKENGTFIGAEGVRQHLKDGPPRRRVGMVVEGHLPGVKGAKIFDPSTKSCAVTSGIPSPSVGTNIAMGYVLNGWHKKGTEVEVEVRSKMRKATLTPMPFIKPKYWRGAA